MKRAFLLFCAALALWFGAALATPAEAQGKSVRPLVNYSGVPQPAHIGDLIDASLLPPLTNCTNPCIIGPVYVGSGQSQPSVNWPEGSIWLRSDEPQIWQQGTPASATPALVQSIAAIDGNNTVTLGATPTIASYLIAFVWNRDSAPTPNANWTACTAANCTSSPVGTGDPYVGVFYRQVDSTSFSTTQTPSTSTSGDGAYGVEIFEVSGLDPNNFNSAIQAITVGRANGCFGSSQTVNYTTSTANTLTLAASGAYRTGSPGTTFINGYTSPWANTIVSTGHSNGAGTAGGTQFSTTTTSALSISTSTNSYFGLCPNGHVTYLISLNSPGAASWQLIGPSMATVYNNGTFLTNSAKSLNCTSGLTCTVDGLLKNITIAGPSFPACADSGGNHLNYSSGALSCGTSTSGPTISGSTPVAGNCVKWASATQIADQGAACGTGGGGGGTTNYYAGALIPIQTQTLSAAAASVSFTSIPQGYQDLVLVATGRGDTASTNTNVLFQVNGDSGSNYDSYYFQVHNTTPSSSGIENVAQTSVKACDIEAATAPANASSTCEISLNNYSGTTFQKTGTILGGVKTGTASGNQFAENGSFYWRNTAAITSLNVFPAAGNFVAGSTFTLYGRSATNVTVNPQPGLPVICEVVTSGSQSSVTVGGGSGSCPTLPSTYRDLRVVVSGRGTAAANDVIPLLRFNSDSGTNYDYNEMFTNTGAYTSSGSSGQTSMSLGRFTASSATANYAAHFIVDIPNYAGTTLFKTIESVTSQDSGGTERTVLVAGRWKSTSAVSSLTFTLNSGNFVDGSVVTVYGIGGSPTATLPVVPPQGRLTLTSGQAVMTADVTAATTIYWQPQPGGMLPVGNVMYRPGAMSYALNATAHANANLYDIGAYNNGGVIALCTAPAWTNSTTRAAAIIQDPTNGVWENAANLTCNLTGSSTTTTVAAGQWTYLGTFETWGGAGQTAMQFQPAATAGGTNNCMCLYNAYQQVPMSSLMREGNTGVPAWTYASATWRAWNASNSDRISWVDGLGQSTVNVVTAQIIAESGSTNGCEVGVALNSTSTKPQTTAKADTASATMQSVADRIAPTIGFNFLQAVEYSDGGTCSYFPDTTQSPNGTIRADLMN